MKLVTKLLLILSILTRAMTDEEFVFPPKFSNPNSHAFTSDSSLYLPPEAHTPLPYFPMKNSVNLPFPYLPPTRTKAPPIYPSPFPMMMSTTFIPHYEDDGKENDERENKDSRSTPKPSYHHNNDRNRSENYRDAQAIVKRDMRLNYQHPIDRVDVRLPMGFSTPNTINLNPTARSMIIDQRNDIAFDQQRTGSSQASHYIPPPGGIFISSTTEPAIPILRLSNEMDLDGSFSYEALGADQTHYVQQSHMENMGTDKEEQVVEGSYSYVGDNGQTYTVHYIADSNGFRASGDHLPVAPPIPEIIQRSIQYNLAEEAKKPPHLKSWQQDGQEHEGLDIKDSHQRFSIPPPPRNLFTGRTPEAFSNNFSQRSNSQSNQLQTAASSQHPVQAVPDFNIDQNKGNQHNSPIGPQVTFLASQGAHVPSVNAGPTQMSRIFTPEKTNMPQLINYDAAFKDIEQDSNKALWRWQYGLNSQNVNQTPEKNSISRSFGEDDDIMINFSDMSSEQYSKMMHSNERKTSNENLSTPTNYVIEKNTDNNSDNKYQIKYNYNHASSPSGVSTENTVTLLSSIDEYKPTYNNVYKPYVQETNVNLINNQNPDNKLQVSNVNQNIVNRQSFIPSSQITTQTYYYENSSYEPEKVHSFVSSTTTKSKQNYINNVSDSDNYNKVLQNKVWADTNIFEKEPSSTTTLPVVDKGTALKFSDFIIQSNKSDYMLPSKDNKKYSEPNITTTTEKSAENILSSNVFLNKIVNTHKPENKYNNIINDQYNKQQQAKTPKNPKFINSQNKFYNDIKTIKKKPLDISEVLNLITSKNHFESSKIGPKNGVAMYDKFNPIKEIRFIPMEPMSEDDEYNKEHENLNSVRAVHHQSEHEIPGNIKNYKLLLRNNRVLHGDETNEEIKRELIPPPMKRLQTYNLPPLGRAGPSVKTYLPPIYV